MDSSMQTVLARAWTSLVDAAAEPAPFSLGYFGTVGLDGAPQVRAVLIRGADIDSGTVVFATNAASAKTSELARDSRSALTFFDEEAQLQLRLTGKSEVVVDSGSDTNSPYAMVAVHVDHIDVLNMSGPERIRHRFTRDDVNWDGSEIPA